MLPSFSLNVLCFLHLLSLLQYLLRPSLLLSIFFQDYSPSPPSIYYLLPLTFSLRFCLFFNYFSRTDYGPPPQSPTNNNNYSNPPQRPSTYDSPPQKQNTNNTYDSPPQNSENNSVSNNSNSFCFYLFICFLLSL